MTSRTDRWVGNTILMILMVSAPAACADSKSRGTDPQGPGSPLNGDPDATRSMRVEPDRLGFDHTLRMRHSKTEVAHDIHDGDTVKNGDRIRAEVMTSEDAYLYLAFCAGHALAIYPSQRGMRTTAGTLLSAPEVVLDGDPGPEVLYLILSRTELSLSDPHLAEAIFATDQGPKTADCGAGLDAMLAKPASSGGSARVGGATNSGGSKTTDAPPAQTVLRGERVRKKPMPASHKPGAPPKPDTRPGAGSAASAGTLVGAGSDASSNLGSAAVPTGRRAPPPDPDPIRKPGDLVWYGDNGINGPGDAVAASADGIAVVRYGFTHVASASAP